MFKSHHDGVGAGAGAASSSAQGPPRVRVFRMFGRRFSAERVHQDANRCDQDSSDSENSSNDRNSPNRGRRTRSKKVPVTLPPLGNLDSCGESGSSCSGFGSSSSSSQQGAGSSSDSGSNNGDNSPESTRVSHCGGGSGGGGAEVEGEREVGASSESVSETGQIHHLPAFLRPFMSSRCHCCDAHPSTLQKVFKALIVSKRSLGAKSSSCMSLPNCQDCHLSRSHHHSSYTLSEAGDTPTSTSLSDSMDGKPKQKKSPGRILRSPVSYAYVRGISGLPTQRVPRHRLPHPRTNRSISPVFLNFDR